MSERVTEINRRLAELMPIYKESKANWEEVYQLRKERASILMPAEAFTLPKLKTMPVKISELRLGDRVLHHGFVCVVDEIFKFEDKDQPDYPVYVCKCTYESGDLSIFNFLRGSINNGCDTDYRAHLQSNDRCSWERVA